ncbi:35821_t:CDS:2 [Gigaspora margarita]|uniref:35821_t:CDS:1 n=1 Tax=Gigaspora margarita TaxID=4874 RepID=A0ABM8W2M1_GIGMA|nr:35821_t:CDS:2 [Gigaspora margarita]
MSAIMEVTNPNDPYSDVQYNVIQNVSCAKQFNNQGYSSCNNHFRLSNGCWIFTPYTDIKDFNNPCGEGLKNCIDMTSFSDKNSYFTYKQDYHDLIILNISLFGPPQLNSTSQFNISDISNIFSISLGQLTIAEFSPKVHYKYASKFNAQLGFMPTQKEAVLDINLKLLPLGSNNNYTLLAISPKDHLVRYEKEKYIGIIGSVLSSIGGFYTAVISIFILFFGYPKHSPWKSFKDHLAKRYISRAGIPLVDDPRKLPSNAALEDRIAILETLLKEYYLDTSYLDIIKETRDRYIGLNNIY